MSRHTRRLAIIPPAYARGLDSALDTFTDTDGTSLLEHKPDGGGFWIRPNGILLTTPTLDNGRVHNVNDVNGRWYAHSARPRGADYEVSADVVMRSDNNLSSAGVFARMPLNEIAQQYFARYNSNGNTWQLYKNTPTLGAALLGSFAQELTIDQAYRLTLRCQGSAISVLVDSVEVIAVTDAEISSRGRAGVRLQQAMTSTVGVHLDNFQATALD